MMTLRYSVPIVVDRCDIILSFEGKTLEAVHIIKNRRHVPYIKRYLHTLTREEIADIKEALNLLDLPGLYKSHHNIVLTLSPDYLRVTLVSTSLQASDVPNIRRAAKLLHTELGRIVRNTTGARYSAS